MFALLTGCCPGKRNTISTKTCQVRSVEALGHTKITDAGLENLKTLTQLKELYLDYTRITGTGLRFLSGLSHLELCSLELTQLNDEGLVYLGQLKGLKDFDLLGTHVSEAGVRRFLRVQKTFLERYPEDFDKNCYRGWCLQGDCLQTRSQKNDTPKITALTMVLAGQHRFLNRWAEGQRGTGKNLDFFPIRTILEAPKDLLRHAAPVQEPVLPACTPHTPCEASSTRVFPHTECEEYDLLEPLNSDRRFEALRRSERAASQRRRAAPPPLGR